LILFVVLSLMRV